MILALIALAAAIFVVPRVVRYWVRNRIFPYRNEVIRKHFAHAFTALNKNTADVPAALRNLGLAIAKREAHVEGGKTTWGARKVKILDFGCGMGDSARMLFTLFGDAVEITSIDVYTAERWVAHLDDPISGETLESTRLKYDGSKLPFEDGSFDLAVAGQVLHHIPDNMASLREIFRVSTSALVLEDLIKHKTFQASFCFFWDSLWNWDFFDHPPHTNRQHDEWVGCFKKMDKTVLYQHFTSIAFAKDMIANDPTEVFTKSTLANGLYIVS